MSRLFSTEIGDNTRFYYTLFWILKNSKGKTLSTTFRNDLIKPFPTTPEQWRGPEVTLSSSSRLHCWQGQASLLTAHWAAETQTQETQRDVSLLRSFHFTETRAAAEHCHEAWQQRDNNVTIDPGSVTSLTSELAHWSTYLHIFAYKELQLFHVLFANWSLPKVHD